MKVLSLVGKVFGRWSVIEKVESKNNLTRWLCRCVCGKEKIVRGTHLTGGASKSCGCLSIEKTKIRNSEQFRKLDRDMVLLNGLYAYVRNSCKKRCKDFDLTKEEFRKIVYGKCHYCGESPGNIFTYSHSGETTKYNGIDRVDSSEGYTLDNCVSCCWRCNAAKNNMTVSEFRNWIEKVYIQFNQ